MVVVFTGGGAGRDGWSFQIKCNGGMSNSGAGAVLIYIHIYIISTQTHKEGEGARFPDDRVTAHHEQP